jgi:hypothetical protein
MIPSIFNGPLLICGPPLSGKTTFLKNKILDLLDLDNTKEIRVFTHKNFISDYISISPKIKVYDWLETRKKFLTDILYKKEFSKSNDIKYEYFSDNDEEYTSFKDNDGLAIEPFIGHIFIDDATYSPSISNQGKFIDEDSMITIGHIYQRKKKSIYTVVICIDSYFDISLHYLENLNIKFFPHVFCPENLFHLAYDPISFALAGYKLITKPILSTIKFKDIDYEKKEINYKEMEFITDNIIDTYSVYTTYVVIDPSFLDFNFVTKIKKYFNVFTKNDLLPSVNQLIYITKRSEAKFEYLYYNYKIFTRAKYKLLHLVLDIDNTKKFNPPIHKPESIIPTVSNWLVSKIDENMVCKNGSNKVNEVSIINDGITDKLINEVSHIITNDGITNKLINEVSHIITNDGITDKESIKVCDEIISDSQISSIKKSKKKRKLLLCLNFFKK